MYIEETRKEGFLKIGNEIFEVEQSEMETHRAAYKLKCYSAVSSLQPFNFGDTLYYTVSVSAFYNRQELTEEEYINHLISLFFVHWIPLLKENSDNNAFALSNIEISSRDAYTKHLMIKDSDATHKLLKILSDTVRNKNE